MLVNEEVTVATSEEMRDLGRQLAGLLRAGDVIILGGPLGAGKTTLTKGIGDGLGVRGPVTSPTFVIARVHPSLSGGTGLVHADAYRLGSALELDDLDLDADTDTSVTVVEWGEGLAEGLSGDRLEVMIVPAGPSPGDGYKDGSSGEGDQPRTVRVRGVGERWRDTRLTRADVINRL
jgi:tRNA threonylcarbamoyladenosine biosynthesis protein TsaE